MILDIDISMYARYKNTGFSWSALHRVLSKAEKTSSMLDVSFSISAVRAVCTLLLCSSVCSPACHSYFLFLKDFLVIMRKKYLSAFLATGAVSLTTPAMAISSEEPNLDFFCKMKEGVPTTVVQFQISETQLPIFHWKPEVLATKSADSPEQLCNLVSGKLSSYSADGYDLSQINFVGTEQDGMPVICANLGGTGCSKILLTLDRTIEPAAVASNVVDSILAKNLQQKKTQYKSRGVQSISYQVDFWSLLGLGLKPKFLGK